MVLPLQTGRILAYGIATGRQLWDVVLQAEHELAADERHVYVASGTGVQALHLTSGALAWQADLGAAPTAPPLAHGGWVIAAAGGVLHALRAADGKPVWTLALGTVEYRPALDGDTLIVPVKEGRLHALQVVDGSPLWAQSLGSAPLEPFAIGGRVYVGATAKVFFSFHTRNGRTDYERPVGGILRGHAAVDRQHVYIAGMDNVLFALDRGTGSVKWRQGLTYRPASGPVVLGSMVIVPGSHVRTLPAYNAAGGTPAGKLGVDDLLAVRPAFVIEDGGRILLAAVTGSLAERFRLVLKEPSLVPALPQAPLKELPGEMVPIGGK